MEEGFKVEKGGLFFANALFDDGVGRVFCGLVCESMQQIPASVIVLDGADVSAVVARSCLGDAI